MSFPEHKEEETWSKHHVPLSNLPLLPDIATSSVARAWSGTFDDMLGNVLSNYFSKHTAMGLPGLAPYPDFFAAGLILVLSGIKSYFSSF